MKRTKLGLEASTSKRLLGYAAAGTATVAVSHEASDAAIMAVPGLPSAVNATVPIDFDGDGIVEFVLSRNSTRPSVNINHGAGAGLAVAGVSSYAGNLAAGQLINGFATAVSGTRGDLAWGAGFASSQFLPSATNDPNQGFLGVAFTDGGGNPSFGWIEVAVDTAGINNFQVLGAAWSNDQNILAGQGPVPEPGSLGLLALGGAGLLAWRRRRKSPMA